MPLAVKITMAAATRYDSLLLLRDILNDFDVVVDDDDDDDDEAEGPFVVRRRFHFSISSSLGGRWEQDICLCLLDVGLE